MEIVPLIVSRRQNSPAHLIRSHDNKKNAEGTIVGFKALDSANRPQNAEGEGERSDCEEHQQLPNFQTLSCSPPQICGRTGGLKQGVLANDLVPASFTKLQNVLAYLREMDVYTLI